MSRPQVSIRELRNHGGDVVDRVAAGENLTVTRPGKPVAELRPVGPLISTITPAELSVGPLVARTDTERAARQGRNPRTGEPVQIPASRTPKFQPAKGFKDSVNG